MTDHNATDAVSRRNVLKATGGLLAGSTMLAGLGAGRGAATEEGLQFEVEEANEDVIIGRVRYPDFPIMHERVYLGWRQHFTVEDDAVSLPENHEEVLATPVEIERLDETTYRMFFRTEEFVRSTGGSVEDEKVTLGLGVFTERTVSDSQWDTVMIRPKMY